MPLKAQTRAQGKGADGGRGGAAGRGPVPGRTTVTFPVATLDCTACGGNLRAALRVLPGVLAVAPNVGAREVAVTFDSLRLTTAAIRARLDALGLGHR